MYNFMLYFLLRTSTGEGGRERVETLILASKSPRRHELIRHMNLPFTAEDADVDEHVAGTPQDVVLTLAQRKAQAVSRHWPERFVLGADTVVYACGQVLGKPTDAQDAMRMIGLLSDGWHEVHTGVCLVAPNGQIRMHHECTRVHFVHLSQEQIAAYVATGEPFGKAGAYAIQGTAGMYVDRIEGSFSNVIGLPTQAVHALLRAAGYPLTL